MAITAKLEMRQGQQLVMTPQLQQAIRLLQLSNLELSAFVEQELERNPLLEREDGQANGAEATLEASRAAAGDGDGDADGTGAGGESGDWVDLRQPSKAASEALDTEPEALSPDSGPGDDMGPGQLSNWSQVRTRNHSGDEDFDLEAIASADVSLKDHLASQLHLAIENPIERLIGQNLVDLVDDAGYLAAPLDAVASRLGAPLDLVERVLSRLQTFEPAGVFARSLSECLAIQLRERNRLDPLIQALLDNLELLAKHNLAALKRAVGCDMDELADMIGELKSLNPKPGLAFGSVQVQVVVPDIFVRGAADGGWHVELNTDTLPRVLVNRTYYTKVSQHTRSSGERDYLLDCLHTANWLVKSLDQRARTILRVSEEIVRQQDAFFALGVQHLRPLNLKTVADAISMHESTVSRVTSNKYMATPRGIFELKYFFTSAIAASDQGEAHSSESVRHRIRQLIDAETCEGVLSDDMIVDCLRKDGIDIARRTVAKYREAMRIPSSVQRRRQKRIAGQALRVS